MTFPKLRIAWSVVWGLACVLLIVLWLRSYWRFDSFDFCLDGNRGHWLGSVSGELTYERPVDFAGVHGLSWTTYDGSAEEWLKTETPHNSIMGFRWGSDGTNTYPIVPHWFVALLLAVMVTLPWLTWRFSLRTLLIATSLVATTLGTIAWLAQR